MDKIKLSKSAKQALLNISLDVAYLPRGMDEATFSTAVSELEDHGLVMVAWESGHVVYAAELTDKGTSYLESNPTLRNPVDWKWIITTAIALVAAVAALVACSKI